MRSARRSVLGPVWSTAPATNVGELVDLVSALLVAEVVETGWA